MKRTLLIGCPVALIVATLLQRQRLLEARAANRELAHSTAQRATAPSSIAPADTEESSRSREALRELPRLRNQVRELREQKRKLASLREANDGLQKRLAEATAAQKIEQPSPEKGFLMNSVWTHSGYASPEAALQTFFCALRDGNVSNLLASLTPDSAQSINLINNRTGQIEPTVVQGMRALAQIHGYRVAGTTSVGDDKVTLNVQAAVGGAALELQLRRVGQEWKVDLERGY